MASSETPAISDTKLTPAEEVRPEEKIDFTKEVSDPANSTTQPVEMNDSSASKREAANTTEKPETSISSPIATTATSASGMDQQPESTKNTTDTHAISSAAEQPDITSTESRISGDESAIGPAIEKPLANVAAHPSSGLQLVLTLLLHSTDTRHPYIINEKYLNRRNVQVADNDPANLTVYNQKDLIWRDWRDSMKTVL